MNLKLFKPNYKTDKLQQNLDFAIFSNKLNNLTLKKIFDSNNCKSTQAKVRLKMPITQNDIHEHNYQLKTIFKLYYDTFRKKSKEIKDSHCLRKTFHTPIENSKRFVNNNKINSDINTLITGLNPSSSSIGRNKKESHKPNSNVLKSQKNMFQLYFRVNNSSNSNSNNNQYQVNQSDCILPNVFNLNKRKLYSRNKKMLKYSDCMLRNKSKDDNTNDENVILYRLKKEYKFFSDKECMYDQNKWKMFPKSVSINESIKPPEKHSVHRLKMIKRKQLHKQFSID